MLIRPLRETELTSALFDGFHRHQVTTRCKKKIDGVWREVDCAFVDEDWDADDLIELTGAAPSNSCPRRHRFWARSMKTARSRGFPPS